MTVTVRCFRYGCVACDGKFQCHGTVLCISTSWVCDGENDCGDNSDELNCTCSADQFQCNTGVCVPQDYVCDGENDCEDFSDERNCNCADKFQCNSTVLCVSPSWVCDGDNDCEDWSDERGCACNASDLFKCPSTDRCIKAEYVCDGDNDCGDGSDELNYLCRSSTTQRPSNATQLSTTTSTKPSTTTTSALERMTTNAAEVSSTSMKLLEISSAMAIAEDTMEVSSATAISSTTSVTTADDLNLILYISAGVAAAVVLATVVGLVVYGIWRASSSAARVKPRQPEVTSSPVSVFRKPSLRSRFDAAGNTCSSRYSVYYNG